MANKKQIITNTFFYGAIGDRISGFRTSEIYNSSAKTIKNLLVTDVGTLKVAKQFKSQPLEISGDIINTAETSDNTYLLLTSSSIYLINKSDNSISRTITHSLGNNANFSLIGKELIALFDRSGNSAVKIYNIDDLSENVSSLKYPIKDKEILEMSIWRVSKDPIDANKLRLTLMSNFTNPKIKISNGNMYLTKSDIQIKRIYITYNTNPQIDYFTDAADGDIYGVLRVTPEVKDNKSFIVDNTKVTFTGLTTDSKYKGEYFTGMSGGDCDGIFAFGNLVDITQPTQIGFYQDRAVFYVNNYLYFSKLREYFDFRNDISNDSPFFIQLNPINNTIGSMVGMVSANGLYILTTAGIYVIGYGMYVLTPSSISASVIPVTDMGVGRSYEVLDNILYFINYNGVLKALIMDRASQQLAFNVVTVDKYSSTYLFADISKISIDDKDYIVARGKDNTTMYLIEPIDYEGLFRKVSLDFTFTHAVFGLTDRFIMGDKVFTIGDINYPEAYLLCNPPSLKGDSVLTDVSSRIESMAIKLINQDKCAIDGVVLNGTDIQNLSPELDHYSIYKKKCSDPIANGYSIKIKAKENDKIIEIQTLQLVVNVIENI